jgi:hypothetical protein
VRVDEVDEVETVDEVEDVEDDEVFVWLNGGEFSSCCIWVPNSTLGSASPKSKIIAVFNNARSFSSSLGWVGFGFAGLENEGEERGITSEKDNDLFSCSGIVRRLELVASLVVTEGDSVREFCFWWGFIDIVNAIG